jgi:hypothetical protein
MRTFGPVTAQVIGYCCRPAISDCINVRTGKPGGFNQSYRFLQRNLIDRPERFGKSRHVRIGVGSNAATVKNFVTETGI